MVTEVGNFDVAAAVAVVIIQDSLGRMLSQPRRLLFDKPAAWRHDEVLQMLT